ncbi:MAG TPA: hypothetical protein VFK86_12815 [Bauldia sp.]|nr:hypothetical protein [Bauldia sp.]
MSDLEKRVLEEIGRRQLTPRPYAYFLARRSVFWTLAAISILLGAVSVAVAIYGVWDLIATGGKNFDEMPFDDVFETLPFVWGAIFVLLVASAYVSLRHTPRNYRYRPGQVVGFVIAAAVVLGGLMAALEVGKLTHQWLLRSFPFYERLVFSREDIWREPDKGYLGGRIVAIDGASLALTDFFGKDWTVDIAGAEIDLEEPIEDEEELAIRGVRTGPAEFRATRIEEWE